MSSHCLCPLRLNLNMAKRSAPPSTQSKSNGTKRARADAPTAKANGRPASILKKPPPPSRGATTVAAASKSKGKGRAVATASFEGTLAPSAVPANAPPASKTTGFLLAEISKYKKTVPSAFEVVAGSYERILYGLHCVVSHAGSSSSSSVKQDGQIPAEEAKLEVAMEPVFQFPAHLTCVKTAAASPNGRWLVTGAADEVIKVWDLRRRKEVGGLLGHEGGFFQASRLRNR